MPRVKEEDRILTGRQMRYELGWSMITGSNAVITYDQLLDHAVHLYHENKHKKLAS